MDRLKLSAHNQAAVSNRLKSERPKQAMASLRKPNAGSFRVGNPGGGRPRGARSRLHELAIEMLRTDFERNGADVIRHVRERKPEVYLASVVSLLPKQTQVERRGPFDDVSDQELQELEELLAALRAKNVRKLELLEGNGAADAPPIAPDTPE